MTPLRILQEHYLDKLHHNMIIFFLVFFAGSLGAAADPYHISIDGVAHSGRYWLREGSSTVSTAKGGLITARMSVFRFSYSLQLSPGQKIIRLHFQPSSYIGFESSNDLFSVEAGNSSLLANFSASVAARALAVNVVVKQFCVTVEENETLNLAFSPEWGNSYAFVNEIEIISIPSTTPLYSDGEVAPNLMIHVDSSTALERVHYQHVKWGPVSSEDDIASMFGMWSKQPSVGEDAEMATSKTWIAYVDVGFDYMVRLHLCEIGLHMDFVLLINGRVALTSADMLQQRRGNREFFWFNNYMVMDKELKQGDISVSLHSRHEFLDRHGPLEGFEVYKMSSHHSPSWTLLCPLRFFSYITIIFHICCMVFIVYLEDKMSQCEFTNEDNKPSSRAKQLSHRFSQARILGICEYGGVGKGFVDYGREIVGIKPLEIDSKQRENKFRTVFEQQEMILVDKHIPSGTLADHLDKLERKSNDLFPQSWKKQSQICIEVSRALKCLHTGPTIMSNDLKPANILLDDKFVARLSDFGLSKTMSFSQSQSQDSTKLIGTRGYIGPGFITSGELTKQSDILSFGELMLKVMRGRAAREPLREEDKCVLTTLAERTKVEDDDSKQRENKFQTVIEQQEMILVEYISSGTMADHLDKLGRKSNDFFPQSWKQRQMTCIELSLAQEYLHAGHTVIHHDLKPENILPTERLRTVYKSLYNKKSAVSAQVESGLLVTGSQQQQMPQGQQVPLVVGKGGFGRVYRRFMSSESDQAIREWQAKPGVLMDSLTGSQKCQMPLGFRFHPTDELMVYYLWKRLKQVSAPLDIDLYNYEPWDLPKRSFSGENEWFNFSRWDRKRAWGATSRHQKATGMFMPVILPGTGIGKSTLMSVIYGYFKANKILLDELYRAKLSALTTSNLLKEWQVLMDSQQRQMPLEIRFHPTDEEDYGNYSVGLFNYEPWDLPKWSFFGEQKWFFFILRDRKRATSGHHKATGMHNPVVPKGITEWAMMLEYMLEDDTNCPHRQYNDWLKHMIMIEYPPSKLPLQKLTFKSHWN